MTYPQLSRAGGCYSAFREPAVIRRRNLILSLFVTAILIGNAVWR
ncbi:hypothetical protein [Aquitalea sp. USM4]|nr:hypothetical protein [Aquitalea sp. USM4]